MTLQDLALIALATVGALACAIGLCTDHSNWAVQTRPVTIMANSDRRGSSEVPNRQNAPSRCALSAKPALRIQTLSGPSTRPRGPAMMAAWIAFCSSENVVRSSSGKRGGGRVVDISVFPLEMTYQTAAGSDFPTPS